MSRLKIIHGIQHLNRSLSRAVVTIGNFDGVHLGHQEILAQTIRKAEEKNGISVAFTFRPHPRTALYPEIEVPLLTTYEEKLELLSTSGIDLIIEEPFSREFSSMDHEQFFTDIVLRQLNAEAIVVGYDFAFGKERQGHLQALEAFCQKMGVELTVVPPKRGTKESNQEVISSSIIRQHCLAGEVEIAARLLGRFFSYRGIVVKGDGRGKKIGFPTANLKAESKLLLPNGVYATLVTGSPLRNTVESVTNIGVRPTFNVSQATSLIETHLIGLDVDLYGSQIEVKFVKRLREEKKFSSAEQLVSQIKVDIETAKKALS